jgi:hypothetical protein
VFGHRVAPGEGTLRGMDLHADPDILRHGADRLARLAGELTEVAGRLDRLSAEGSRSGRVANRCAALVTALRADAAELSGCEALLRQDRSGLLAGEASVLEQMSDLDRRLGELSGRAW